MTPELEPTKTASQVIDEQAEELRTAQEIIHALGWERDRAQEALAQAEHHAQQILELPSYGSAAVNLDARAHARAIIDACRNPKAMKEA